MNQPLRFVTKILFVAVTLLFVTESFADEGKLKWELKPTGSKASLRGLSTPSDRAIWACGSNATVIRSEDGGESWIACAPSQFASQEIEFRSIHAWDTKTACIATAGTPAVILRTDNGGLNWSKCYEANSEKAFFDGLRFWDRNRGIAFSDPVDGRLLIVETEDGGRHWQPVSDSLLPKAATGEAGFAASNSSLEIGAEGAAWIGTGGTEAKQANIYYRQQFGAHWTPVGCPMPSAAAAGVFSIAASPELLVALGGDYRPDANSTITGCFSKDGGRSWSKLEVQPVAFRSAVVGLSTILRFSRPPWSIRWLAVGPTGSDFSRDGLKWENFSTRGFHALSAAQGEIYAVGSDGRFAKLEISKPE